MKYTNLCMPSAKHALTEIAAAITTARNLLNSTITFRESKRSIRIIKKFKLQLGATGVVLNPAKMVYCGL